MKMPLHMTPPVAAGFDAAKGISPASAARPGETFTDVLNRTKTAAKSTPAEEQKKAQKAAGDLVANALILPLLKQIRQDPFGKDARFSGGIGEKTFGPEFDIQIADRIAESPNMGLTKSLADGMMRRGHRPSRVAQTEAFGSNVLPAGRKNGGVDVHG